ncbi:hypothetical protein [Fodinibius roseus]|nr:hypothetical protein [Fodinibius roseus]
MDGRTVDECPHRHGPQTSAEAIVLRHAVGERAEHYPRRWCVG